MQTPTPTRILSAALAGLALAGCAALRGAPAPEAAPAAVGRLIVAPLNLAVNRDPALAAAEAPVWDLLIAHLGSLDRPLAVLEPEGAASLWAEVFALEHAEAKPDFERASGRFAQRLAEQAPFDLLVLPALVQRPARVHGRDARWDGVSRPLSFAAGAAQETDLDLGALGLAHSGWTGSLAAASLHVALLTPEGRVVHQGVGGLDLVQTVAREEAFGRSRYALAPRPEAFGDPSRLREGIARAFAPGLTRTARAW
jgi:hypothetical protein